MRDQLARIFGFARSEIRGDHCVLDEITLRATAADAHALRERLLKQRNCTVPVASGERRERLRQRRDNFARRQFADREALS